MGLGEEGRGLGETPGPTRAPRPPRRDGARRGPLRTAGRAWLAFTLVALVSGAAFTGRDGWRPRPAAPAAPTAALLPEARGVTSGDRDTPAAKLDDTAASHGRDARPARQRDGAGPGAGPRPDPAADPRPAPPVDPAADTRPGGDLRPDREAVRPAAGQPVDTARGAGATRPDDAPGPAPDLGGGASRRPSPRPPPVPDPALPSGGPEDDGQPPQQPPPPLPPAPPATTPAAPAAAPPAPAPRPAVANPVTLLDVPDPAVLRTDDGYLAFSTQSRGHHVPVLASRDLTTWWEVGDALPQPPTWSRPGQVWAPDVWRHGDRHVLYYSTVDTARGVPCISAAQSAAPAGPYADRSSAPLVCQYDRGGSIDPSPFRDADGRTYLHWKSEGLAGVEPTRVWVAPLSDDGLALADEPREVLQQDRPWETPILEGPDMVLVGGEYHLFYSANRWETADYAIGHAICASVRGPCEKTAEGPWLGGHGDAVGPGGPDVFTDAQGDHWLAYHAWPADSVGYPNGARRLHLRPLGFVGGGPGHTRAVLHAALDGAARQPFGRRASPTDRMQREMSSSRRPPVVAG